MCVQTFCNFFLRPLLPPLSHPFLLPLLAFLLPTSASSSLTDVASTFELDRFSAVGLVVLVSDGRMLPPQEASPGKNDVGDSIVPFFQGSSSVGRDDAAAVAIIAVVPIQGSFVCRRVAARDCVVPLGCRC